MGAVTSEVDSFIITRQEEARKVKKKKHNGGGYLRKQELIVLQVPFLLKAIFTYVHHQNISVCLNTDLH
jgi:hypothetical protein